MKTRTLFPSALGLSLALVANVAHASEPTYAPPPAPMPPSGDVPAAVPVSPIPDGFSFKGDFGGAYRSIYATGMWDANLELAVGAITGSGGWYGTMGASLGKTSGGLSEQQFRFGVEWENGFDRLRLGLGLQSGYVMIHRVTDAEVMDSFSAGLHGFAAYELYQWEGHALRAQLRMDVEQYLAADAPTWGPTLGLGIRY